MVWSLELQYPQINWPHPHLNVLKTSFTLIYPLLTILTLTSYMFNHLESWDFNPHGPTGFFPQQSSWWRWNSHWSLSEIMVTATKTPTSHSLYVIFLTGIYSNGQLWGIPASPNSWAKPSFVDTKTTGGWLKSSARAGTAANKNRRHKNDLAEVWQSRGTQRMLNGGIQHGLSIRKIRRRDGTSFWPIPKELRYFEMLIQLLVFGGTNFLAMRHWAPSVMDRSFLVTEKFLESLWKATDLSSTQPGW